MTVHAFTPLVRVPKADTSSRGFEPLQQPRKGDVLATAPGRIGYFQLEILIPSSNRHAVSLTAGERENPCLGAPRALPNYRDPPRSTTSRT